MTGQGPGAVPAFEVAFNTMVGEVEVGATIIEGVSDGSLPVPPTSLFNKTNQDWLQHSQFPDVDGMLTIEIGGFHLRWATDGERR